KKDKHPSTPNTPSTQATTQTTPHFVSESHPRCAAPTPTKSTASAPAARVPSMSRPTDTSIPFVPRSALAPAVNAPETAEGT
ncbi:hypothetical protein BC938DRAFT_472290, partial [Jimgerdemannia flammicorona]